MLKCSIKAVKRLKSRICGAHSQKGDHGEEGWILPVTLLMFTFTSVTVLALAVVVHSSSQREQDEMAMVIARNLADSGVQAMIAHALAVNSTTVVCSGGGIISQSAVGGTFTATSSCDAGHSRLTVKSEGQTPDGATATVAATLSLTTLKIVQWRQQP